MVEYPVSDALRERLNRQMLREATVGADTSSRNEMDGRSRNGAARQFAAASRGKTAQGGNSGVYLAWSNPTAKRKGVRTAAPFRLIEGGRE